MSSSLRRKFPLVTRNGLTGVMDRFFLLGPFNTGGEASPCDALRTDYLGDFGGEGGLDIERFQRAGIPYVIGAGFKVNLLPLARASGSIMYAMAVLESTEGQAAIIRLGSDKGYKLFVNNKEIGYLDEHRGLAPDNNEHPVRLRKGTNLVLMKVENVFGAYEFVLRIEAKKRIVQLFDMPDGYPAETLEFKEEGARPVDFTRRLRYSGSDYFATLAETSEPALAFKARDRDEMARWRVTLRRRLRVLMGPEPPLDRRPALLLSEETVEGDLVRMKIALRVYKDSDIPCYLLRPKKLERKVPGVIAIHGHGYGAYPVAGVTFGTKRLSDSIETSNYDYGLQMARQGFVVICPTARGFGERGTEFDHDCDVLGLKASLLGMNLLALNLYDFMRCIDYLHGLPFVDSKRTGCVGLSSGGTFAYHLAALDTRITATVVSCAMGSWREQMWHGYACGNQFLHGIMKYADSADVAALIAPRALCVESGRYDSCFMFPSARAAHALLRRAYRVAGRPGQLCIDAFPGPHRFHGERSLSFLRRQLGE